MSSLGTGFSADSCMFKRTSRPGDRVSRDGVGTGSLSLSVPTEDLHADLSTRRHRHGGKRRDTTYTHRNRIVGGCFQTQHIARLERKNAAQSQNNATEFGNY